MTFITVLKALKDIYKSLKKPNWYCIMLNDEYTYVC